MPSETAHVYDFRPVEPADLARLGAWLAEPHVARWWSDPATGIATIEAHIAPEDSVEPFLVLTDGRPIGYLQSYRIDAEEDHPYRDQPPGTVGIDQFIGEADLVGRGHGPRFIDDFVRRLFESGVPRVLVDPAPDNTAAIRAYDKAGFRAIDRRTSIYGPAILMVRDREHRMSFQ